jgi:hypothetical protein
LSFTQSRYTAASWPTTDVDPQAIADGKGVGRFAGSILVLDGLFSLTWGLVALLRDQAFYVAQSGNAVNVDYTVWGWLHLLIGLFVAVIGFCVLFGMEWAQLVALVLAATSAVANVFVIPAYPIWSIVVIALDVLVIWAITVHGPEMREI